VMSALMPDLLLERAVDAARNGRDAGLSGEERSLRSDLPRSPSTRPLGGYA